MLGKLVQMKNLSRVLMKQNTDSQYTLYLLGKGGKLGISSTEMKGIRVIASWEKPKDKIDSWLIFND